MPRIAVTIDSSAWQAALPEAEALAARAVEAALGGSEVAPDTEISIVLSGDDRVRALNRDYRGADAATNVLAFTQGGAAASAQVAPVLLGDVIVAYETAARESADQNKPLAHHLSHLLIHGVLHLLGYDHDEPAAAERMEDRERQILAGLRIPDPYEEKGAGGTPHSTAPGAAPYAQQL